MNEADKKAFKEACKDWAVKSAGKDLGEYFWQAALEWRDSQVGKPAGWIQFVDGKQTQNFCRDKEEIQAIDSLSRLMNKNSGISYQPVFLFSHGSVSAEKAWAHGYKSGVEDERMSEANIGIAGLGGKINPARENPYRNETTPPTAQINQQLLRAQTMGQINTPDFLEWLADRLVHVYKEPENVDFVLSLRERAKAGRAALTAAKSGEPK